MFIGLSGAGGPDWMIGWTWKRQKHWTWDRPNPSLSPIEIKIKHYLGGIWDCHYLQSIYETTMNNHGEWNTTWGDHPSRVLPAFVVCNMVFISLMQSYSCAKGFCLVNNAIVGTCGSNILISETKQVWSKSMFFLHYFAVDGRYQVYQLAYVENTVINGLFALSTGHQVSHVALKLI